MFLKMKNLRKKNFKHCNSQLFYYTYLCFRILFIVHFCSYLLQITLVIHLIAIQRMVTVFICMPNYWLYANLCVISRDEYFFYLKAASKPQRHSITPLYNLCHSVRCSLSTPKGIGC